MSEGFVPAINPCCGIHAVAEACELPFQSVWSVAKFATKKKASWRGRTTYNDRLNVLNSLEAIHYPQSGMVGKSLIEACFLASQRGGNYIFDIAGHSLAFRGGLLIDQTGSYCPTVYNRRFHNVDHATKVHPIENFDEEKLWEKLADPLDYL